MGWQSMRKKWVLKKDDRKVLTGLHVLCHDAKRIQAESFFFIHGAQDEVEKNKGGVKRWS